MEKKHRVVVCLSETCCQRGSKRVLETLERDRNMSGEDAEIRGTPDCFRFCKLGPNVAVNGNVLHGVRPADAVNRIRREIVRPSRKHDALGTRSIDELDDILGELGSLP